MIKSNLKFPHGFLFETHNRQMSAKATYTQAPETMTSDQQGPKRPNL